MQARALVGRWPITATARAKVIKTLVAVVADKEATPRAVAAAIRGLLAADRINLDAERLDLARGDGQLDLSVRLARAEARDESFREEDHERPARSDLRDGL